MILFTVITDKVILRSKRGVYRQVSMAKREGLIYAQVGNGFIMLYANGVTSDPNTSWVAMEGNYLPGKFGRLTT